MRPVAELALSHYEYARAVLFEPPEKYCKGVYRPSYGVVTILQVCGFCFFLVFLLHATLPTRSPSLGLIRLAALPCIISFLFPLTFDRNGYTLGSDFRDIAIPACTWLPLAEALKVCLVSIWDPPHVSAPRWIVPKTQAHKWAGAQLYTGRDEELRQDKSPKEGLARKKTDPFEIPQVWYVVPHPPLFSWRRMLWALDNMGMRRPGTSWLLPWEQRGLEWCHHALVSTSQVYRDAHVLAEQGKVFDAKKKRREAQIWFGQTEWGWTVSLLQLAFIYRFYSSVVAMDFRVSTGPHDFYALPLWMQYYLTFGLGTFVAFTAAAPEKLVYPIMRDVFRFPVTCISPTFQRPLLANGPTDFWSRRWHQWLRRDFANLAKLIPIGRESKVVKGIATFWASAAEHNYVFSGFRRQPPTAWHAFWVFFAPCIQGFFLSQALCMLIEQAVLGPPPKPTGTENVTKTLLRRSLLWFGLLTSGRWVTGYLMQLGAFDPVEFTNWGKSWSIIREMQQGNTT